MTIVEESCMEEISDGGSIPPSSRNGKGPIGSFFVSAGGNRTRRERVTFVTSGRRRSGGPSTPTGPERRLSRRWDSPQLHLLFAFWLVGNNLLQAQIFYVKMGLAELILNTSPKKKKDFRACRAIYSIKPQNHEEN